MSNSLFARFTRFSHLNRSAIGLAVCAAACCVGFAIFGALGAMAVQAAHGGLDLSPRASGLPVAAVAGCPVNEGLFAVEPHSDFVVCRYEVAAN